MASNRTYRMQCCVCETGFTATRRDGRYCSHACASAAHRRWKKAGPVDLGPRECARCGVDISSKRRDARFCSNSCASLSWYYDVGRNLRDREGRTCPACEGAIDRSKHANAVYCSVTCRNFARRVRTRGLTVEEYQKLLADQNHACAICLGPEQEFGRAFIRRDGWHIDHDHETGRVRGVLCPSCNLLLGFARNDISTLTAAVEYLRKV